MDHTRHQRWPKLSHSLFLLLSLWLLLLQNPSQACEFTSPRAKVQSTTGTSELSRGRAARWARGTSSRHFLLLFVPPLRQRGQDPWDLWGRIPPAPHGQLLHVGVCWRGPCCSGAAGPRLLGSARERVLAAEVPTERLLVMLRWLKQMSPSVRPLRWRES